MIDFRWPENWAEKHPAEHFMSHPSDDGKVLALEAASCNCTTAAFARRQTSRWVGVGTGNEQVFSDVLVVTKCIQHVSVYNIQIYIYTHSHSHTYDISCN